MGKSFLTYALAAVISFAGVAGSATFASANGWDNPRGVQHVRDHRDRHFAPPPPRRPMCSPRMAESKARNMGLRRAQVVDVSPRRVVVAGVSRHGRDRIVFSNSRGCPVLRR